MDAIELGATLYVPATRSDLAAIASGRQPSLRSAVICLEDSIAQRQVPEALDNLARLLDSDWSGGPALFVRPRDSAMLARIARLDGADRLKGYVIPKATADNLPDYLAAARDDQLLMPTLETAEALDPFQAARLREQLLAVRPRILALRIGGNDLLQTIGARRSPDRTAYEGPLGAITGALVAAFAPFGFQLSAPVFEYFGRPSILKAEVERDLDHGLYTKTAIHPIQVPLIHACYRVSAEDHAEAAAILAAGQAVFGSRGAMCEESTHRRWAQVIRRRGEIFGIAAPSGELGVVA
ncbi:MAG TPA: HpcH/HpaI aldolase/citrate lyase family protein [Allosphingosinicella sp.]|jgi:citrate lyase beta subunit|nr:HpcH/HpaI aldolase/citrate lyase family protein [Allosphingosinicella sp.]